MLRHKIKKDLLKRNGKMLEAVAYASEGYSERPAHVLCDNSGMSGYGGLYHTHGDDTETMWLSIRNPKAGSFLEFDLSRVCRLSCMAIWNFNQTEEVDSGLKEVKILSSSDGKDWEELKGPGYPYVLAKASGEKEVPATNLENPAGAPIDFEGKCVRYVRILPEEGIGRGCHGGYIEDQYRHGLSAVRFFEYREEAAPGSLRPFRAYSIDNDENSDINVLSVPWGLYSDEEGRLLLGENRDYMWLSRLSPDFDGITMDMEGTYPVSSIKIWNYNEAGHKGAGMCKIRIFYGTLSSKMTELKGEGYPYILDQEDDHAKEIVFNNLSARYIKLVPDGSFGSGVKGLYNDYEPRYGLGKIMIFTGEGTCFEPDYHLTSLLSNYRGFSGADGIFMAPFDGVETQISDEDAVERKNLIVFGDTFISDVNPVTRQRKRFTLVNNSLASFLGNNLEDLKFEIPYDEKGVPQPVLPEQEDYVYWMQDCFVSNGFLYSFADNIQTFDTGREGFMFRLVGIDMIKMDLADPERKVQTFKTPLFCGEGDCYYGCAVLPNTHEAGMPGADGYFYIYGLKTGGRDAKSLVVARCKEDKLENFASYEFFDGEKFVPEMDQAAVICEDAGAEMSINPITYGPDKGKYLMIYTHCTIGACICGRIADTPRGPFGPREILYDVREYKDIAKHGGTRIYAYNAKSHYHISKPDDLIVTCNFNTQDFESHIKNAEIYRPRFYRLKYLYTDQAERGV